MANILQIIPQIGAGGAEKIVLETAKAVVANKDECFVFTSGGFMQSEFEKIGARVLLGKAKSKNPIDVFFNNPKTLRRIIKENRIDLIHVHSRAPALSAQMAAKKAKIPWVATYHGIYPAKNSIKRAYNSIMTKADIVIANSLFTQDYLIKQHKPDLAKVRLVYCGIDSSAFSVEAIDFDRLAKARALLNSLKYKILLPARLTSWKGQLVAIKAAKTLKSQNRDFIIFFMGDAQGRDDYVEQLRTEISQNALDDNVKLVGHFDDVASAMAVCDLVITPSIKPEAFGLSAAEAQMLGKITIASRLGASVETVCDNETGFLFEPDNNDDLAQKIIAAMDLPDIQKLEFSAKARKRAIELFDTSVLHSKTLKIYDELLKSKRVRAQ